MLLARNKPKPLHLYQRRSLMVFRKVGGKEDMPCSPVRKKESYLVRTCIPMTEKSPLGIPV